MVMGSLKKLRCAILALLAGFSSLSFAGWNITGTSPYTGAAIGSSSTCYSTQSAACSAIIGDSISASSAQENYCAVTWTQGGTGSYSWGSYVCSETCPAGQSRINGVCQVVPTCTVAGQTNNATTGACECPAGQEVYNGACTAKCETYSDEISITQPTGRGWVSPNQCVGGCGYTLVEEINNPRTGNNCTVNSDSTSTCAYLGKGSGQHCTSSAPSTATAAGNTPQATPTSTTTNTSTPPVVTPPGTVPTQSGTTTETTTSGSTKVNADGTVTTTTTTTTKTTNPDGSTSTSTQTGTSTEQGGNGKGVGTGDGEGTGEGEGGGDCDPLSKDYLTCMAGEQTPTDHTAGTNATTFGEALNNFGEGISGTPIGGLATSTGIGGSVNVGSCPTATFEFFGSSILMDSHCSIYDAISPTLTSIMHVVYVVMGILIILSA